MTNDIIKKAALALMMVLLSTSLLAQGGKYRITGKVIDESEEPIFAASVVVSGTTRGAVTDEFGEFSLDVSNGEVLVVSYLGMSDQNIVLKGQKTLTVKMHPDALSLEQVVVVGYGTQKKESVVGAISQVKGEDLLTTSSMPSLSSALNGMVSGLSVLSSSGKPGEESSQLLIRGMSSWTSSAPMVLVDGIERRMEDIDVNEIESMSVLKDASATAVYGVRGGNGVILITTKRGEEGKLSLNVFSQSTLKTVSKLPTLLNSYEARVARNFAIENGLGDNPTLWTDITTLAELQKFRDHTDPYLYPDVNWQKETIKDFAFAQKAGVELRGGTKFVKYFGMLSYLYDGDILRGRELGQGYVPNNDYQRINVRSNFDFNITPTTVLSADLDVIVGKINTVGANATTMWKGVWRKAPDEYPVLYEDGVFGNDQTKTDTQNTVEVLNYSGQESTIRTDANASLKLRQDLKAITPGLSFNAIVNFRNYYSTSGPNISSDRALTKYINPRTGDEIFYYPSSYTTSTNGFDFYTNIPPVSASTANNSVYQDLMYQASLNYKHNFGGNHDVSALALFKRQQYSTGAAFASYREEWAARVTYGYKSKYLFEANGAYNGSEKFGPGNKFGFFPSIAGGWVISGEDFFKDNVHFVDFLKLRYSWGIVGSDDGIAKWLYSTQWKTMSNTAAIGYPIATTPNYNSYYVSVLGNPNARWETAYKNDVALESTMFGGNLSATFDYYWGRRTGIFLTGDSRNVPPWFGADPVSANIGETRNWGWEFEAKYRGKMGKDWKYQLGTNLSYTRNLIVNKEDPEFTPDYQKAAGKPINQPTGLLATDILKSWDDIYTHTSIDNLTGYYPGFYALLDYNADGVINANDNVPSNYNHYPMFSSSFSLNLSWKKLSLSSVLVGQTMCSRQRTYEEFPSPSYSCAIDADTWAEMWIPGYNDAGTVRHVAYKTSNRALNASQLTRADGTLWRLQTVELSYLLNTAALHQAGISSIRMFLNGNNLWLYSHMSDDREANATRAKDSHSAQYPKMRRFTFGVNVNF